MQASAIIIGNEILSGHTLDKNYHYIARLLFELGIELTKVHMVGDKRGAIMAALDTAWEQNQIIITSGGMGPTKDDITKDILGDFFSAPLQASSQAEKVVNANYARADLIYNKEDSKYHLIPTGMIAVNNPCGLAPGLIKADGNKVLIAAPGVPQEFSAMMEKEFVPLLKEKNLIPKKSTARTVIRTHGISEKRIFFELAPKLWDKLETIGKVSALPILLGVDIVVATDDAKTVRKTIEDSELAPYVWQYGESSLASYILEIAKSKGVSISLAESCTGGLAASLLTDVPGSSEVFLGSAVTYDSKAKINILGVSPDTIKKHGIVSMETAQEMAEGARKKFASDFALSFTGYADPPPETGKVAIALATHNKNEAKIYHFKGGREELKMRFSRQGLFNLLKAIKTL